MPWTRLRERTSDDPLKAFKKAVENAKPLLEVKTRRVGGANYQVPIEVPQNRRTSLAMRWIITNARDASGKRDGGKAGQRIERRRQYARRSDQEDGTMCTAWRKPTRPSRITGGKENRDI